jgi:competence ComEA-like helix-hairpin-helix protein
MRMKNSSRVVLFVLVCALIAAVAIRAAPAAETPQTQAPRPDLSSLPDSPHTALFVRLCVDCHDAERTSSRRRTRVEWAETIRQMVEDGADGTEEELALILDYLLINFGAVSVNTAKSEDFVKVLAMSSTEAEAVVAYRTAHGPFADIEALAKVPGIDPAKLEARKRSLRF